MLLGREMHSSLLVGIGSIFRLAVVGLLTNNHHAMHSYNCLKIQTHQFPHSNIQLKNTYTFAAHPPASIFSAKGFL